MKKSNLAKALAELTMCKEYEIKPNFSELSRKTGIDRHTLKKYYERGGKFDKERSPKGSKYDELREFIRSRVGIGGLPIRGIWFAIEHEFPKQAASMSYRGLVSYIRKEFEAESGYPREAHPRFETGPGEQLQVDWKESLTIHAKDGSVVFFNVFSATLSWSRYHAYVFSVGKGTDDFCRCLIEVLRRIGGVPKEILTDNMSAVVSCTGGGKRKLQAILQLEKDIGCRIRLCKPRTPETKGKVESSNRFVNWIMAYDGLVEGEADLKDKLLLVERDSNREVCKETSVPPASMLPKEAPSLSPLPNSVMLESYVAEKYVTSKVPSTMLVQCRGVSYSVPRSMIGRRATAIPSEGMVYIFSSRGELVAEHRISRERINYLPSHYREALEGKVPEDGIAEMAAKSLERLSAL